MEPNPLMAMTLLSPLILWEVPDWIQPQMAARFRSWILELDSDWGQREKGQSPPWTLLT